MRKIVVGAFASLDGVMQAPGGPQEDPTGGFRHGGWVAAYWDEQLNAAMTAQFSEPMDLLLGRRTYDIFAAHWPYVQMDPNAGDFDALNVGIAELFNRITKYVATHRPDSLGWKNSRGLGTDIVAELRRIKAEDGPMLLTQGSTELLRILLENDLVDELRLITFPLVLGKGKRLFGSGSLPSAFKLVSSSTSTNGAVVSRYERAGEVATASFEFDTPTTAELERRKTLK